MLTGGGRGLPPHGDTPPTLCPHPERQTPSGTSRQDGSPDPPAAAEVPDGDPAPQPVSPRSLPGVGVGEQPRSCPAWGDPGGSPGCVAGRRLPVATTRQHNRVCACVYVCVHACALRVPVPTAAASAAQPQRNARSNHSFRWLVRPWVGFFFINYYYYY